MRKILLGCICVFVYVPTLDGKGQLPSFVKVCKRTDPELETCVKESIENLKPYLGKGIPEMRIPPFDPLRALKMVLDDGNIKLTFNEMDFKNFNEFELNGIQMDIEQCKLAFQGLHPALYLSGLYNADGKILIFELHGSGLCNVNLTSAKWEGTLNCKQETKHNKEYLKFTDIDIKLTLEDMGLYFADLFKDNQQITDTTNKALNENKKTLIEDFTPLMGKAIGEVILGIIRNVFDKFPLDVLLPK